MLLFFRRGCGHTGVNQPGLQKTWKLQRDKLRTVVLGGEKPEAAFLGFVERKSRALLLHVTYQTLAVTPLRVWFIDRTQCLHDNTHLLRRGGGDVWHDK